MNTTSSPSEQYVRRHFGAVQIIQTVIGGSILLVAGNVWKGVDDFNIALQLQAKDIALIQQTLKNNAENSQHEQNRSEAQVQALATISASIIRIETNLARDEQTLEELKRTKGLK